MIQAITTFHRISDGQVTVGCDNESALNLAFNTDTPITSSMADHGILSAIRRQLMNTTITWATQHIRGHQDEGVMPTVLTRFETLNCDMDRAEKEALQRFNGSIQLPLMEGTLWSLSIGQVRIVKIIYQRIYYHVHGKEAQAYW
jgi:hypothetical protein